MSRFLDTPPPSAVHQFERSILDVRRGVLIVDGTERRLRPKSFALLQFLVENPGRPIDREEIMRAVWPNVFVTEDNITQCIKEIRRAIGDDDARTVRTLPKRGYLFAGQGDPAKPAIARPPVPSLPDKPSIAVLPFQNMSGDPDQEYFADGTVEDITTALSRIRWLFVIARNSAFAYKGRAIDIKQVSQELGVRYVLEGSVRKSGNRVRVTAQLIDAITGSHLWADRYDRELSDIFAVQDNIAASVASILEPTLAEAEQQRVLRKPPERLDAWEAYQRGQWHFHKYGADDNEIAQGFFRQTIELDPGFAPGHYGYALALLWDSWLYSKRIFSDIQSACFEEARIAVSLDDKDAMAHAVLAVTIMVTGAWETAIAQARSALALNPNNAFVMAILGLTMGAGGHRAESIAHLRRAMRASPQDPLTWAWQFWMGSIQFYARDFAAAVDTFHEVIRLRPAYFYPLFHLAGALAFLGRFDDAAQTLERLRSEFPDVFARMTQQRQPWIRPDDWALRMEGLRLAAGEPA
jgi:adenylate cyclase